MLEPPSIPKPSILHCIEEKYRLQIAELAFLPIGADVNTAVYRAAGKEGATYFVKLRSANFDEINLLLPHYLKNQGIQSIIAPIETRNGMLSTQLHGYQVIVYPFVNGQNGYAVKLSGEQWQEFGASLRRIHETRLPEELSMRIPLESYSTEGREWVKEFQHQAEKRPFSDPVAVKLAAFMRDHREQIRHLVERADSLASVLQSDSFAEVLCHGDLHAGNLLISADNGDGSRLYIVDWDNSRCAPKELDLSMIGGSQTWNDPQAIARFYQGYGQVEINRVALAYYRYERIIQDIAEFCKQLLLSDAGGEDRQQSYRYFTGQFLPGNEVEIAFATDRSQMDADKPG
jgi:spectinomycin phosphotransferase